MTILELVLARAPFDADMPAVRENGQRQLEEVWAAAPKGTWLAWCASRSGVSQQKLVAALCTCADWMKDQLPASTHLGQISIEPAREWSSSGRGREQAISAGWEIADQADAAVRAGEPLARTTALWALADLLLTVRGPLRAPQAISGFSQAIAAAGGNEAAAEAALGALIRKAISWDDIKNGLTTPASQPATITDDSSEKTVSRSERTIESMDRLLKQAAELQQQFDSNLQEVGLSRSAVSKVMNGSFLDEVSRGVARATVDGLDAPAPSSAPKLGGKRARLRI